MELSLDLQSIQEARTLLSRAAQAQRIYKDFSQERVDKIVKAMAEAGYDARERLAKLAVEETGFGKWQDKVKKNIVGTKMLYDYIKDMKTCGIVNKTHDGKVWEIATPMGVVAALIPTTNPTSTMMYKAIIALKSRNAIVASPHPRAVRCTVEAAKVVADAAKKAGAPDDLVLCMTKPTLEGTSELMRHELTSVILATGSSAMVRAAYSSGKPAYGVGPGNVPAFIERSANIPKAVADILFGKTFDNGTLCSSEQSIVCDLPIKNKVIEELKKRGAHFVTMEEKQKLERYMFPRGLNPEVVGMPATFIAERAGFSVPPQTTVLVVELGAVGKKEILSAEKLSPVLGFYVEDGWEAGCKRCIEILEFGGIGHSLALHTQNPMVIEQFALHKPAFRILINTVAAVGAVGYTTALPPSMTLGPGTIGGSITTDNITPLHLLNIKRVAFETNPVHDANGNPIAETATEEPKPVAPSAPKSFSEIIEERIRLKAGNPPVVPTKAPKDEQGKGATSSVIGKLSDEAISELVNRFKK
ncbi:MAG: aldehyde dehydrogenase family protein [Chloroherpetonaceae bacterium]|nr:aldehyde dehydrogenase family protein [Chloroherpetonaceae bacterium]MDW8437443.1 aldehyde dehydrogenase family protein [Chloroherpetonaceae bacterium]